MSAWASYLSTGKLRRTYVKYLRKMWKIEDSTEPSWMTHKEFIDYRQRKFEALEACRTELKNRGQRT